MYKFLSGLLVVAALTPFISYAALTDQQIASVAELVRSFGADESAVRGVTAALGGAVLGATTDLYPSYCPELTVLLQRGSRDSTTGGQVTELQKFLSGYYDLPPADIVTGYFGVTTHGFVVKFQTEYGLIAQGYVGPQTRAKIASVCEGTTSSSLLSPLPGAICPAIAYMPIECATGAPSPRYDANSCQNGWVCTPTATTTAAVLNVTLDASSPAYKLVAAGTNDVVIGAFKLRAGGESVMVQKMAVKLTSGVASDLAKVAVYDGATKVGDGFILAGATTATITLLSNVLVPKDTDKVLTIKGDFSLIGTGEPIGVSGHLVQVDFLSGQGVGTTSGTIVNATGSTAVAGVRVTKSFLTVTDISSTLTPGGLADGRLMRFKVTADPHGPVGLTQLFVVVSPTGLALGGGISNVNIYGYEDAGFSTPISGVSSSGALRSTDTSCLSGCTAVNLINIGVTRSSGVLGEIQIPAGTSRYFEVRSTVTGVQSGASVTTKLVGDGAYTTPVSAVSLVGKDAYFIWSPNSTTTARRADNDWFTGFGISGLPAEGIKHTRTTTVVPTSSISVTAPNGGERWESGTMNTITWSPYSYNPDVNPSRDVKAYLEMKDDAGNFVNVGTILPSGKASIHWDGDINTYGKYPTPADGYYIRVVNTVTGQSDRSDASFTILPKTVDLKVNGLDSGALVADNQLITLSWTTANYVFSNGCTLSGVRTAPGGPLASAQVPANGSVMYYAYAPVSGSYTSAQLACVDGAKGLTHYDYASYTANASAPAYIKILTPNGGELQSLDQMLSTYYTFAGLKSASIALYKNDQWLAWLTKDIPVTGSTNGVHSFIPSAAVSGLSTGQVIYKIYITGSKADGTGYVDDKSDSAFSFVQPVATNAAPLAPGFFGPATGVVGQSYSVAVYTTDPNGDQVRYGHNNGTVSQTVATWSPASGYVNQNSSTLLGNFQWSTTGVKTIWARAEDSKGALSPWSVHTVTITAPPTTTTGGTTSGGGTHSGVQEQ